MLMNEGNGVTLSYVGTGGGNSGAETKSAGRVDFYSVTRDHDDGIANGTRFHFGREDPAKLAALQDKYAAQGMRTGTQAQSTDYNEMLRDMPYQQHLDASDKGEWFADLFVNWANGTLTDNAQGDAIDDWMNDHAQDWIQMGLDAKAVKDKAAAEKAKKQKDS